MSATLAFTAGGLLSHEPNKSEMTSVRFDEVTKRAEARGRRTNWRARRPGDADTKWPAWKVTVVVIVFCSAFWGGLGYIAMRMFGG